MVQYDSDSQLVGEGSGSENEQPRGWRASKVTLVLLTGVLVFAFVCGYATANYTQLKGVQSLQDDINAKASEGDCGSDPRANRKVSRRCRPGKDAAAACKKGEVETETEENKQKCIKGDKKDICCKCEPGVTGDCVLSKKSKDDKLGQQSLGDCGSEGPKDARTISRECRNLIGDPKDEGCKKGERLSKTDENKNDCTGDAKCCVCDPANPPVAGRVCTVSTKSRSVKMAGADTSDNSSA